MLDARLMLDNVRSQMLVLSEPAADNTDVRQMLAGYISNRCKGRGISKKPGPAMVCTTPPKIAGTRALWGSAG